MTTHDLITRREAVNRLRAGIASLRRRRTTDDERADWFVANADELHAILTILEASDADTVRTALQRCERIAKMKVEQCLQRTDGRGLADANDTHGKISEIVQETLTASHPKPEPVETQPEASRSPVSEERAREVLRTVAKEDGWHSIKLEADVWKTAIRAMLRFAALTSPAPVE